MVGIPVNVGYSLAASPSSVSLGLRRKAFSLQWIWQ